MTIPAHRSEPVVEIGLGQIYDEVQTQGDKLDKLTAAVEQMVAINQRLDQHHLRLNDHGSRIGLLETANATAQAVAAAVARPRTPWYSIVAAVTGIITGVSVLVTLIAVASKLGALIG